MKSIELLFIVIYSMFVGLTGCKITGESDDRRIVVSSLVAAAIYRNDEPGSEAVCNRASKALTIIQDVKSLFGDDEFQLIRLEYELRDLLIDSDVNPVTREALIDLARQIVAEQLREMDLNPEYENAKVSLLLLADIVESIALNVQECEKQI